MKSLKADLHIHTVLSPCATLEMLPPYIVERACETNIQLIAITDHNASANVPAVIKAAAGSDLTVLPGIELTTAEEIHVICLFDTYAQLAELQKIVDQNLPNIPNNPDFFGMQLIVDSEGNYVDTENRLLSNATHLTINEAQRHVLQLGGLFLPAHVTREENGLLPRLGGIPPELNLSVLEISGISKSEAIKRYPFLKDYHLIPGTDAHDLDGITGILSLQMEEISVSSLLHALQTQY
jgi:PHP family Zn ribbon phosphoesterase